MSGQDIDLSGEAEPTELMTAQDAKLDEEQPENHRKQEFRGEDRTEEFDLDDALARVGDDGTGDDGE